MTKEELLAQIDEVISEVGTEDDVKAIQIEQDYLKRIDKLIEVFSTEQKVSEETKQELKNVVEALKAIKLETPQVNVPTPQVTVQAPDVKVTVPPIKIPEINIPETIFPDQMSIKEPTWLAKIFPLKSVIDKLDQLIKSQKAIEWPTSARKPVSVRLSDGEKFYRAMGGLSTAISNAFPEKDEETVSGSTNGTFLVVPKVEGKRIKVNAMDLFTQSQTGVTITFKDGPGGNVIGTYPLQAITDTVFGITKNLPVPSSFLRTSKGNALEMSFSGSVTVIYNLNFWRE